MKNTPRKSDVLSNCYYLSNSKRVVIVPVNPQPKGIKKGCFRAEEYDFITGEYIWVSSEFCLKQVQQDFEIVPRDKVRSALAKGIGGNTLTELVKSWSTKSPTPSEDV